MSLDWLGCWMYLCNRSVENSKCIDCVFVASSFNIRGSLDSSF